MALHDCVLALVIIGPNWLGRPYGNQFAIHDEHDPTRIEVQEILRARIEVVPLLIDGARLPKPTDVPESIKAITYHDAAWMEGRFGLQKDIFTVMAIIEDISLMDDDIQSTSSRPNTEKRNLPDASIRRPALQRRGTMEFDIFVSYAHDDKAVADTACASLEAEGIRCWIAPRDVPPGLEWASSIVDAINHCRAVVLIFSSRANRSKQIHREVQQGFDKEKPVIPFRIEDVAPEASLAYYMGPVHWLDALSPPL
jgi:hypothetical protein